ncbi:NUDIX hydrolase [Bacillus thuringiensis]|uniref:NUDIX hydrolase n=1 Tax=Bacillus thuringiensis TaxID=1428 RepID=UPI0026E13913|nr:NUDIX hydrolase [Bacillus thuringiensis]MDO6632240.1 NUDIX hydrolase [Bacillus thuringiensis]MDO6661743.1 NUDIX hydrolase [Bacillus thuringiensis]MDO6702489.1 NUDIX hydrolase [Bacillus thuringiensis]
MDYVTGLRKIVGHLPLILVGAVIFLIDEENRILLQKKKEPKGLWGIPGGLMELGESIENTAKREVYEETGLLVEELTLFNVFSGESYFEKLENKDEFYAITVVYSSTKFKGKLQISDDESLKLHFYNIDNLPEDMLITHRNILYDFLKKTKV